MAQRQCDKCGDLVDEAKAFCPGCGQALVEEKKRKTTSEFESVDHTVQMGNTMYNQMLSDMGLNISKQPNAPERKVEPVAPAATAPPTEKRTESVRLASTSPMQAAPRPRGYLKWIIIAAVIIFLAFAVILAAGFVVYWLRVGA